MITLSAKINLIEGKFNHGSFLSDYEKNNISSSISSVVNKQRTGNDAFILGSSTLGDGSKFSSQVDYYIDRQLSNAQGFFENPYKILIKGSKITAFNITFDTKNNKYPYVIVVNGETVYLNSATATITLDETDNVEIQFETWTSPNSPMVITGIFVEHEILIDRRNLLSLNTKIIDRSDEKLPSYGIISNGGNVSFNDIDGKVLGYAEQQLLQSGLSVYLYINNTLTKRQEQIGCFSTDTWNYDNNNNSVSVALKDNLQEMQDINISGIDYNPKTTIPRTFTWLYARLREKTPEKYKIVSRSGLDEKTRTFLDNSIIEYPILESCTLWSAWQKFCEATQCHMYQLSNGNIILRYNGGN